MITRAGLSDSTMRILAMALTIFCLSGGILSSANDYDSLRSEIAAANASGSGTITLGGDIVLRPPRCRQITGSLTIDGGGHSISGDDAFRIFDVNGGALTLSNVTLTEGNAGEGEGGAIRMRNGAQVTIERATLSANSARHGGAIATSSSNDRLATSDVKFISNIAEQSAGAIYARGGTVGIANSRFEKNCAQYAFFALQEGVNSERRSVDDFGCIRVRYVRSEVDAEVQSHVDGGAIRLLNGARVIIEQSTFSENRASYGAAISTASKDVRLSVSSSSFLFNRASQSGGAIGSSWLGGGRITISASSFVENSTEEGDGGAIESSNGALDIINSTFGGNRASGDGGALKIDEDAEVSITHATFVDNWSRRHNANAISKTGGTAFLRNSIVTSAGDGEDCVGAWEHAGNLSSDGTCADRPSDDPRLGVLTGSPAYYPPLDRSQAIDYADPKYCLETDQLGTLRPQGGGCDIGAIEARAAIAAEPTRVPPLVCTLAYEIVAANRDWPAGGCPAGSGVDIIELDKDIILFEPLPAIASHIIIEGNGHSISGDRNFRIFDVDGGILTIRNLTMKDGRARSGEGGAIRLQNDGRATVSDSRFINNLGGNGSGVSIGCVGTDRSWLNVNRSSFVDNSGIVVFACGGTLSVSDSSFVRNSASGVFKLLNPSTRLDIVNSSFIRSGRALFAENGATANLTHVTIGSRGRAIETYAGSFTTAGRFNLRNSIIAGSVSSDVCDNLNQNIGNLIADGSCSPKLSGDPMLEEPRRRRDLYFATCPAARPSTRPTRASAPIPTSSADRAPSSGAAISARLKPCRSAMRFRTASSPPRTCLTSATGPAAASSAACRKARRFLQQQGRRAGSRWSTMDRRAGSARIM